MEAVCTSANHKNGYFTHCRIQHRLVCFFLNLEMRTTITATPLSAFGVSADETPGFYDTGLL